MSVIFTIIGVTVISALLGLGAQRAYELYFKPKKENNLES